MKFLPLWKYIEERESIRLAKLAGKAWPWTKDKILQAYKFTNVKRLYDRTTQAFLRVYFEHANAQKHVALLNCAARRFTGTAEMSAAMGWLDELPTLSRFRSLVEKCPRPWTGAYMIRADAPGVPKADVVHTLYLKALWKRAPAIVAAIDGTNTWEAGYNEMRECYGFGPFMSKEVLQDYLLWLYLRRKPVSDDLTFTPIGPGGRRGLNRLAGRPLTFTKKEALMLEEVQKLLEKIQPLWLKTYRAEKLTAHDIQFCLCEFDKYERVRTGQGRPRSTYSPEDMDS